MTAAASRAPVGRILERGLLMSLGNGRVLGGTRCAQLGHVHARQVAAPDARQLQRRLDAAACLEPARRRLEAHHSEHPTAERRVCGGEFATNERARVGGGRRVAADAPAAYRTLQPHRRAEHGRVGGVRDESPRLLLDGGCRRCRDGGARTACRLEAQHGVAAPAEEEARAPHAREALQASGCAVLGLGSAQRPRHVPRVDNDYKSTEREADEHSQGRVEPRRWQDIALRAAHRDWRTRQD
jgi:hypothetical protein